MKYQNKLIINNLNLNVEQGELLILLGSSGCGKTSLLKIIAGLIPPEKGRILIENQDITEFTPQKREIGYVPQSQVLFPHLNIKENIAFGLHTRYRKNNRLMKNPKQGIEQRIKDVAKLAQIEDLLTRFPSEISGGQKQRVALARAIIVRPRLLLLDEPLSSIDATGRESLALTIKRIQKETHTTTIYVTHNHEEARLIADKVAIMYNGIIQQIGTMIDLDKHPKNFRIAQIMGKLNIWKVKEQKRVNGHLVISSPIGEINFSADVNAINPITGIQIPPAKIEIIEQIHPSNRLGLFIRGRIISIIQLKSGIYQLIVEIIQFEKRTKIQSEKSLNQNPIDYIKVHTTDYEVIKKLQIHKIIDLKITPENINLI